MLKDPFAAPIPGESLTNELGSAPWETPPQFTDLSEATEHMFDRMIANSQELALMLESGATAESIARTLMFSGFQQGKFTPDLALQMTPIAIAMVVAVGRKMGVTNIKVRLPNKAKQDRQLKLARLARANRVDSPMELVEEPVEDKKETSFGGVLGGLLNGE